MHHSNKARAWVVTGALALGAAAGAAGVANAASGSSNAPTAHPAFVANGHPSQPPQGAMPKGAMGNPATMSHGPGETLLTGSSAAKAKAAALAAVPGATVVRVETDSAGAAYEAHLKKSNGTYVTVKLDRAFKVTQTVSGFGAGPPR
jgi:hypothetical protein